MKLIDSHCHLNMLRLDDFDGDLSNVIKAAAAADVKQMLTICTSLKEFQSIREIAAGFDNVSCSVGVHPHNEENEQVAEKELLQLAQLPDVVAIGETGLDYFYEHEDRTIQQQNFKTHIEVAKTVNKPLIIHTRQAQADTMAILNEHHAETMTGVMHCFTENWDMAKAALDLGFYISISGIVTFKKAQLVQEVAQRVPLERLLIETDAPYLAPVPFRGKQNHPALVREVAEFIASLRGISVEALAQATSDNFHRLFTGAPVC